jgi:hypothetical protein
MLLGQTLDGMRVWDIRRAVQMVHFVREGDPGKVILQATGDMSRNARLAAFFEPSVRKLQAGTISDSEEHGPDYLQAFKFLALPEGQ